MAMYEIKDGDTIVARHVTADEWGSGLKFFSPDGDFVQFGFWGYDAGKELAAHAHNRVDRSINITQEVLYIRRGSIEASIYGLNHRLIEKRVVCEGDVIALLDGGHGYAILEDGTQVLEIKNGPYLGAERDRVRF